MKLHNLRAALLVTLATLSTNAFAIDQVILKSGSVIEGKILSDVPNRHVDIQLVNGTKKRYPQTEVASVERDVPSNTDSHLNGATSEIYFGGQLGMLMSLETATIGTSNTVFTWGARGGINVAQLGDFAKLALGLSFNHAQRSVLTFTTSSNEVLAQVLFRKVSNTGFYFGPEFGFNFLSSSATNSITSTIASIVASPFMFGADLGYDYFFSPDFSIGPDVRYQYIGTQNYTLNDAAFSTNPSYSQLLIQLTATFHF